MENVEDCQDYQKLVEHGPDEDGPGEDQDGDGVHHQACHAESCLKEEKCLSKNIFTVPTESPRRWKLIHL